MKKVLLIILFLWSCSLYAQWPNTDRVFESIGRVTLKEITNRDTSAENRISFCFRISKDNETTFFQTTVDFFTLSGFDSHSRTIWESNIVPILDNDSNYYIIKADIPKSVVQNMARIRCFGYKKRSSNFIGPTLYDMAVYGVTLSNIKLVIKSNPEGAESFLIPNRIWNKYFEDKPWKENLHWLSNYRVNTSSTNTFAFVDETVYVVVYKRGHDYKVVKHFTRPRSIENEQIVFVDFTK